ncbi:MULTISPECIES: DUF4130 domain-containing protein [Methanothrix]|jgi:probable DNA metabolism protein|uniref:DUF4130 domain-containing protein n=1 Tax=Methanothrix soehngenii (strain ATCC 5969 / DSM 3671 / JCM 10134 / NBRC 103675 / OCM 69 / GP-6) TaxID=990316 RepID=F4BTB4_METSG|nr:MULTISPECIES: DUF4130 domain-containing protein [Methanothrix]AEB66953.1 hypothetical protein MCON_0028 [Methanothrix soehngenii GP6]
MRVPDDYCRYLVMHAKSSERLLARTEGLTALDLEVSTSPEAVSLRRMVYAVMSEVHRMKAFVRLRPLGDRVLWGYMKPRHKIGEHTSEHFARRNPGTIIVLGNGAESWTAFFRQDRMMRIHGAGLNETLDRLKSALKISEEEKGADAEGARANAQDIDDIWQTYYDSQYCPERKNLQAFRQRMPARDQEAAGLQLMQKKREMTLEDFRQQ